MVEEWVKRDAARRAAVEDGAGWLDDLEEVPDLEFGQGMVVPTSAYPELEIKPKL